MHYLLPVYFAFSTQLLYLHYSSITASDISLDIGSGAASQLVDEAAHHLLSSPRSLSLSFRTQQKPLLLPLACVKTYNIISYANVTVKFYPGTIRLKARSVRINSKSNITTSIWPLSFGDEIVDVAVYVSYFTIPYPIISQLLLSLSALLAIRSISQLSSKDKLYLFLLFSELQESFQVDDVDLAIRIEKENAEMLSCSLSNTIVNATSRNYWIVGKLLYMATNPIQSHLQKFVCSSISNYISNIENPVIT